MTDSQSAVEGSDAAPVTASAAMSSEEFSPDALKGRWRG